MHACFLQLCPAAGPFECPQAVQVENTGTVRLANVKSTGAVSCALPAGQLLNPGATLPCMVGLIVMAQMLAIGGCLCGSDLTG